VENEPQLKLDNSPLSKCLKIDHINEDFKNLSDGENDYFINDNFKAQLEVNNTITKLDQKEKVKESQRTSSH
ncbi:17431_t:CDS:1, partial [Racocetra fulgida]